jgi:hypothetical protein
MAPRGQFSMARDTVFREAAALHALVPIVGRNALQIGLRPWGQRRLRRRPESKKGPAMRGRAKFAKADHVSPLRPSREE